MKKKHLVIYDGGCGMCWKLGKFLLWLDWLRFFSLMPYQEDSLYLEHPSLTPEECEKELKLIFKSGKILGGADAVIQICLRLPLCFVFGVIFWLPPFKQLARFFYPIVANNRHWISKSCGLEEKK